MDYHDQPVDLGCQRVACPKCGTLNEIVAISVVRPGDPALLQLFKGTLNRVVCSACRTVSLVDVPLFYRDDSEGYFVYFIPGADLRDAAKCADAERTMQEIINGFTGEGAATKGEVGRRGEYRLALTRKSFIEKISLHTNHIDDRIVEYIKYQLLNRRGSRIDPIRSELLYDFSTQDEERLPFIVFDRETGRATAGAHVPMGLYRELADMVTSDDDFDEELRRLFPTYHVSVERLL